MWVSVVIPSTNRSTALHETVLSLSRQVRPADEIILSVVDPGTDVSAKTLEVAATRVIAGSKGSSCQRNTALDSVNPSCDLIAFFDDDVELHPLYLRNCVDFMSRHPEVVAACGALVADGAIRGEIGRDEAIRLIRECRASEGGFRRESWLPGGYLAVRREVAQRVRFDERLRLYALYEDFDFSLRCGRTGGLASIASCQVVHPATRSSRMCAKRLGYAQVMNAMYLARKGSQRVVDALGTAARSLVANLLGGVVKRRGIARKERLERLWGNVLGLLDVVVRGAEPERIERI